MVLRVVDCSKERCAAHKAGMDRPGAATAIDLCGPRHPKRPCGGCVDPKVID